MVGKGEEGAEDVHYCGVVADAGGLVLAEGVFWGCEGDSYCISATLFGIPVTLAHSGGRMSAHLRRLRNLDSAKAMGTCS